MPGGFNAISDIVQRRVALKAALATMEAPFANRLMEAGVPTELHVYPGCLPRLGGRCAGSRAVAANRGHPRGGAPACPCLRRRGRELGSVPSVSIKLENVGIAVRDLEEAIAFFTDLGLSVIGRDTVSGEWTATAVGLDGNHAKIAMLQTPDGRGTLELFEYLDDLAIETQPTQPNEIGMHRVAFSVDDIDAALAIAARHDCYPLRGVATYENTYKLTYLRGPSGIIVMLAQELHP